MILLYLFSYGENFMLQSDLTRMTSSPGQSILSNHLVKNVAAHQFCMLETLLLYIKMRRGQEGTGELVSLQIVKSVLVPSKRIWSSNKNFEEISRSQWSRMIFEHSPEPRPTNWLIGTMAQQTVPFLKQLCT